MWGFFCWLCPWCATPLRLRVFCQIVNGSVSVPRDHLSWRQCGFRWSWQISWTLSMLPLSFASRWGWAFVVFLCFDLAPTWLLWHFRLENPAVFWFWRVFPEVSLLVSCSLGAVGLQSKLNCITSALLWLGLFLNWIVILGSSRPTWMFCPFVTNSDALCSKQALFSGGRPPPSLDSESWQKRKKDLKSEKITSLSFSVYRKSMSQKYTPFL